MTGNVSTPCIQICRLVDGLCLGCARTREEIAHWFGMSETERQRVMREVLPARRARTPAPVQPPPSRS